MKITISVGGKFHAFRLSEGLEHFGLLRELFTIYPKFKITPYKIPLEKVKSITALGALAYLKGRLNLPISESAMSAVFDSLVAYKLRKPDSSSWIFHGWNSYCEKSLKKAKKLGGVTVVERSCPHIDFQRQIEEQERSSLLGQKFSFGKNLFHERMAREYEISDYIFVPSSYSLRSFLERDFPREKLKLIPLCNEKMTNPPPQPKTQNRFFVVLCVGGNFYRKGIYYLLKAWQILGQLKDAELIIKGAVPNEFKSLTNQPNLKIISHHLTDAQMNELYGAASLFVLPSVDDGFGMAVVEAIAAGLPVIITENVGMADGIQNGKEGFVVPIRDIEALKERIKFFYDHPEKIKEMGEAALIKAKEYSPEAYVNRTIEVYQKIAR